MIVAYVSVYDAGNSLKRM